MAGEQAVMAPACVCMGGERVSDKKPDTSNSESGEDRNSRGLGHIAEGGTSGKHRGS